MSELSAGEGRVARPGEIAAMPPASVLALLATTALGSFRILHAFSLGFPSAGASPSGSLIEDARGVLYGTAYVGGPTDLSYGGVAFALTPAPGGRYGYSVLHDFTGDAHTLDGAQPGSGLVADPAGNLYGTTVYGGASAGAGAGTVFELARSGTRFAERVLYRFTGGSHSADGSFPGAAPLLDAHGSLFGTTASGGTGSCEIAGPGCGTVYELERAAGGYVERVLYRFAGGRDGATPQARLIADARGALYGTTQYGGDACPDSQTLGCGTVFKLTPGPRGYAESVLYRFTGGATDGANPVAGLYADATGVLYGTTDTGGAGICAAGLFYHPSCGTVFMLQPRGRGYVETVLHDFIGGGGDGYRPESELVPGPDGLLYGTTVEGGSGVCFVYSGYNFGCGTVYAMSPIGGVTLLESLGPGKTGYAPNGLLIDRGGHIFGSTSGNWGAGGGTVFELGG
jgi:uncharacterized repeat protein (TIGR03803 family)